MTFNQLTWYDYPNTTTPITASQMNRIEQGIKDAESEFLLTPYLATQNLFTAGQRSYQVEANDGVVVFAEGQNFSIVPTANVTIGNPADIGTSTGQTGVLIINPTTFTVSWGSYWMFPSGTAPVLTGVCVIPYTVNTSASILCGNPLTGLATPV